ncbi:MAG: hypothetical protein Q9171_006991 [Xanthocarpia ochracea]
MRHETLLYIFAFSALSHAAPAHTFSRSPLRKIHSREVPQEHSHNTFLASVRASLALDNPDNIQDPVFGLLGNAAAAAGQGSITDTDCLHQATADQAFSNAKAAGDVDGMTNALIYAALERNTGKVGLASVSCTAIEAKNPEIAAISQHRDPASPGATATNKAITLELARQIASVGGDPQEALKSGTFAPGDVDDPTAKGNSCNSLDDEPGCIFIQNLLVEDAMAEEIDAAVVAAMTLLGPMHPSPTKPPQQHHLDPTANPPLYPHPLLRPTSIPPIPTNNNIQIFTRSLGGPPPPATSSASFRPFSVNGTTFLNPGAALQRSCAIQHNVCADAAANRDSTTNINASDCDTQEKACTSAAGTAQ